MGGTRPNGAGPGGTGSDEMGETRPGGAGRGGAGRGETGVTRRDETTSGWRTDGTTTDERDHHALMGLLLTEGTITD